MTTPRRRRVRETKKKKKKTRQTKRREQRGGMIPWVVDVKKGIELIKNPKMWHMTMTKADKKKAQQLVNRVKKEYRQSDSKDSYGSWAIKKGYAKRPDCVLM